MKNSKLIFAALLVLIINANLAAQSNLDYETMIGTFPAPGVVTDWDVTAAVADQTTDGEITFYLYTTSDLASGNTLGFWTKENTEPDAGTLVPVLNVTTAGGTISLKSTADIFVDSGEPDVNMNSGGKETKFKVTAKQGAERYMFLRFDLSSVSETVTSAKLALTPVSDLTGKGSLILTYIPAITWDENTITWNNMWDGVPGSDIELPDNARLVAAEAGYPAEGEYVDIDATKAVANMQETEHNITFYLFNPSKDICGFCSNEYSAERQPLLVVTTESGVQTLNANADAYTEESSPDQNFGDVDRIKVSSLPNGGSSNRDGFIRFDLSGISEKIISATLKLNAVNTYTSGDRTFTVAYFTQFAWDESIITWNNKFGPVLVTTPDVNPVEMGENGRLKYNLYANTGEDTLVNKMIDFSYCGYMGGGVPLPRVPVVKTIEPVQGDNMAHIQAAINEVSAMPADENGIRGAILLKAGYYELSGSLKIGASGVVLRGEGQNKAADGGTELYDAKQSSNIFIDFNTSSNVTLVGNPVRITSGYVGSGTDHFAVADVSTFQVGDDITVRRTPNQTWIETIGMTFEGDQNDGDDKPWTPEYYTVDNMRVITKIVGDTIYIDMPVCDAMETVYGGGEIQKQSYSGFLEQCGIENMWLTSYYASSTDENHGKIAVRFRNARNCWAKGVTAQYFWYSCVNMGGRFSTVEDCAQLDPKSLIQGGRRYSFNVGGSGGNLVQRCYARQGRHDYVYGAKNVGPNVYLDCVSEDPKSENGPHQRWGTGLLYDNIYCGAIRVRNRGSYGTGHGWAGAQITLWNVESYKNDNDGARAMVIQSPPAARNFALGCKAPSYSGNGYWFSKGTSIDEPRSLYLQQLKERLGDEAVNNVVTESQLDGTILEKIRNWKGVGTLEGTATGNPGIEAPEMSLTVYPNPNNGNFTIETGNTTTRVNISILNIDGVKVFEKTTGPGETQHINLNGSLLPGTYIIRVQSDNTTTVRKMMVW